MGFRVSVFIRLGSGAVGFFYMEYGMMSLQV